VGGVLRKGHVGGHGTVLFRRLTQDRETLESHRRLPRYVCLYFYIGEALMASQLVNITAVVNTSLHLLIYLKWPLSLRPALPTNQMQTNKLPNKSNNYKTPDLNCSLIYLIPVQRGGRAGKSDACFPEPGIWFGYRLV
jgi:hypothetical protein